ncbi:ABC transporter ATP-binding protein [Candidatus Pantoea multigeneris]|uniref:ABC-type xenobiotic transporter n=1 Tax=Candidatus Pantoea multigeneris TaxID=2608357 RepID=A0ABX0RCC5_9GAMM|nr:ABC transporter ATP-binding protein [Pantoea multigeneris]NIF22444.1 ABC transporter ATP-binding protein [Pantoea multigeneris]
MSLVKQLFKHPSSGRRQVLRGIVFRIIAQVGNVLPFFIAWWAIKRVIAQQTDALFWWQLPASLSACLVMQLLFSHFGQLNCFLGSYQLLHGVREASAERVRHLPLGYFQQQRLGETSTLLTDAMRRVEEIFSHLLPEVITGLATAVLFLLALAWVDYRLTLALIVPIPLGLLVMLWLGPKLLAGTAQQGQRFATASGLLLEFVSGIRTLRLFNRSRSLLDQLDTQFRAIHRASMGIEALGGAGVLAFRLLTECGVVVLFLLASHFFQLGSLSFITWLLFVLVAFKVLDPLLEIATYFTLLRVMRQSAKKITALLERPCMPELASTEPPSRNDIDFRHVSFAYDDQPVLKDISFHAPQGSVTALVGRSGSGKSTLLHLLGGFWQPQQGTITLGSAPVDQLGSQLLYSRLGFVFQDVQLFDGSVLENVRIGKPGASDEAVMDACRAANCEAFIQQLPQGYHTSLGEAAQRLSGGEKQRLSIARAMLKDAPVLLLDEATALLDPLSQSQVQHALTRLARNKTVIMVAHRLRTVEFAEQILVMDNGCIVQRGSHAALMAEPGLYRELWQAQEGVLLHSD